MSITLTSNYRETLVPETVAEIDRLLETGEYDLNPILVFIDEYGEGQIKFYEDYVSNGEDFGYEVVDAFLTSDIGDFDRLWKLQDVYIGCFPSPEEMAEEFLLDDVDRLPFYVVIDWKETADYLLDSEVIESGCYYFRNSY